jgi:hypothetical protein
MSSSFGDLGVVGKSGVLVGVNGGAANDKYDQDVYLGRI